MAYKIYPYLQGSRSARALADALGGRVLRREGSTYRYRPQDVIINWGNSGGALAGYTNYLNDENAVRRASCKLQSFQAFRAAGVSIPRFWTNIEDIPDEVFNGEGAVVCRTILRGHSGRGIVIASDRGSLVRAPLYVEYKKKSAEYRIHVGRVRGESIIIAMQQKRRNRDVPDNEVNWQVRNHDNGFIFAREDVAPPARVLEEAQRAIEALGLDFGACDVIWNDREQQAYVLEVNTACGLEGQTVADYAAFFRRF